MFVEIAVVAISSTQSNRWLLEEIGCPEYHINMLDFDNQIAPNAWFGAILLDYFFDVLQFQADHLAGRISPHGDPIDHIGHLYCIAVMCHDDKLSFIA